MRFLPANAQHIGARHSQQDSFAFGDPADLEFTDHGGFVALVCDGMGGMEFGDAASRTAARAFLDAYHSKRPGESIPDALDRSVRAANSQVVALAHKYGLSEGMGTTLVAAALHENSLYFISVGDSGLYVSSGGALRMINRPHVFANLLDAAVERGALSREDADNHPERESLTSFIGAESLDEIDCNHEPHRLVEGDVVLLASDGLFKTLSTGEMLDCLHGDPQSWPDILVEQTLAKKREHQDNVTVLAIAAVPGAQVPLSPSGAPRARLERFGANNGGASPSGSKQDGFGSSDHKDPPRSSNVRTQTMVPPLPSSHPPPAPEPLPAPAPATTPVGASRKRSRAPWLIVVLSLALAGATWWVVTQYRSSRLNADPQLAEPGNAGRPPGAARPAEINPADIKPSEPRVDSDAPAIDLPLRPENLPSPRTPVVPPDRSHPH